MEASKDNIFQDNVFYIITSEEMIALNCVFSILHLTVSMLMGWLAVIMRNIGAHGLQLVYAEYGKGNRCLGRGDGEDRR